MDVEGLMADTATYGARFVAELARLLGSRSEFRYSELEALEAADRRAFREILRRHSPYVTYAVLRRIETEEPEAIAAWFAEEIRRGQDAWVPPV